MEQTDHVVDNIPSQSFDKVVTYKVRNHLKGHFQRSYIYIMTKLSHLR